MKHKLSTALRLIILVMSPFVPSAIHAQTVAPGPYYAMPAWDQTLACTTQANCPRFVVLSNMNSAAVLDRETGLVWERSPSTTPFTFAAEQALLHCNNLSLGNRKGWRLPSIQELSSLVDADPANTNSPRLPPGHPFQNLQNVYWSVNPFQIGLNQGFVWTLILPDGSLGGDFGNIPHFVWCVHGGKGTDVQ